jgi:hypothetical protein
MSKKPSRRKKARPARKRPMTFRISVEAQEMIVTYNPRWTSYFGQFEFRSPHNPPRRIPVSQSGYLSHFVPTAEVKAAKSVQAFARDEALTLIQCKLSRRPDPRQLPLFQ